MVKDIDNGGRKQKLVELLSHPQNQMNIASQIATRRTIAKLTELVNSSNKQEEKTEDSADK
jgi:hypothetical protein